jgi:hypothetical protein
MSVSPAQDGTKRRAGPPALQHGELLSEHEDLDDEARARAKGGDECAEQSRNDREHYPMGWIGQEIWPVKS